MPVGSVGWFDLTVENADEVRAFYETVVGWKATTVPMGNYNDYSMVPPAGEQPVTGICHAQGTNAKLPPQWLIYITVASVAESAARCTQHGGKILVPPKSLGGMGSMCVIQDPAGAVAALFQPA
jgi:predicted enzyme related to lactoylglutathione lyase